MSTPAHRPPFAERQRRGGGRSDSPKARRPRASPRSARVMRGHKMAVAPIAQGRAGAQVRPDHRLRHAADRAGRLGAHAQCRDARFRARLSLRRRRARTTRCCRPNCARPSRAIVRPGGKTGTRNYIGILTSVNCSASAARFIAREVERSGVLADYPEIDGVVPFVHGTGCGLAAYGEGFDVLRRTQWGYATHANLGGALMVGLGCEVFQIDRMKDEYGLVEGDHFQTMTIQATGGTKKTVAEGVERIKAMLPIAARAKRETRPASEVTLALQCGGSDGYSGITANPALGAAVDQLVRARRHRDPLRDAGDLRRRASADAPRRQPRGRREAGRAHQVVGGLLRAQRRRDEQQSLARQQGGRAHHHPGEVARRRRQGRHHDAARGLRIRRAREGEGLRVHGYARLRPGRRDRAGRGRRQRDVLHHRARLGLRLQADALGQARDQHHRSMPA